MAEIEFSDGKRAVDDAYAGPIMKVTDGAPERHTFQSVMDKLSRHFEREALAKAQQDVIREHFRTWG